jgi:hypothetical protein
MTATETQVRPAESVESRNGEGQPEWIAAELPPQYAEIANQIAALKQQARKYEGVAGALWQRGPALVDAVRELFAALQYGTETAPESANYHIRVDLDEGRHLLVEVVDGDAPLDRRSPQIAKILRTLQEDAGERDRVILASNLFSDQPLRNRPDEHVAPDAMRLIQGLRANIVPTSTLFGIWKSSLEDLAEARKRVMTIYTLDGGIFR